MDDLHAQLNPEQRSAVTAGDGPLLVLAGAGSGKTRVLTTRIVHLIRGREIPPYRILAFTFTNKAAREMRERVERMLGEKARDAWIGTFHSTGVRILRREAARLGWERNFAIYDTDDTEALVKDLLKEHTLSSNATPGQVRGMISAWKNARIKPDAARAAAEDGRSRTIADLYASYEKRLRRNNAFDFDDLIAKPVDLFEAEPEVMRSYSHRFQHVLVDEFQDTNTLQMFFIDLLSSQWGNLVVVGDDDQSIYSWRGARIENILEFETRFQGTTVVRLEQNYRSTTAILEASNHLIAHNRGRKGKKLWTARQGGDAIRLSFHGDEEDEGARVAAIAQEWLASGGKRSDMAVLYRTNAQSRAVEDALRRAGIPYQIVGGTRFYERREVKDVVAYLKAIHNPADGVAVARILNVPRRGIGDTTITRLEAAAAANGWTLAEAIDRAGEVDVPRAALRKLGEFATLLDGLRSVAAAGTCVEVVQAVLDRTGYVGYLEETDPATFQARRENVEELVAAAQVFTDDSTDDPSLRAFLEEISLLSDIDSMQDQDDMVTLMTLHSAKGLEFPVVAVTGLEEGILPHASNLDSLAGLEEERRLFYVGMTRAQDRLHLLSAASRRRFGGAEPMMASRFLRELPESALEIATESPASTRRATWAPRQPSWRSYAEGDPDAFWNAQGLAPETDEASFRALGREAPERPAGPSRRAGARHRPPIRPPVQEAGPAVGWAEDEASQEHVALEVGMRVRHAEFGEGQVQRIEGQGERMKVTVVFGRSESRKFVARYARLVPVL